MYLMLSADPGANFIGVVCFDPSVAIGSRVKMIIRFADQYFYFSNFIGDLS